MNAFYYFSRGIFLKTVRSELSHKTLFCYLNGELIQTSHSNIPLVIVGRKESI